MNDSSKYPFDENNIHQTQSNPPENLLDERTPFNDVIKHGDIVQGSQSPKKLKHVPKWFQNPLRLFTTITLLIVLSTVIYQIIQIITAIISEK